MKMIISASYRTDIPAFYGEWLMERLRAGYAMVANPYSGQAGRVDLRAEAVDGIVFWTRNFGPLLGRLGELRGYGRPFMVQFTVTGYPRRLERAVVEPRRAIEQMRRLAGEVHARAVVWRYDPIVYSAATDEGFHLRNFERLSAELEGVVDEVVVSFAQMYAKTRRGLEGTGLDWDDPAAEVKARLGGRLREVAAARGMRMTVCTQPDDARAAGCGEARCVDAARLIEIGGYDFAARVKGNREGCLCHESRDIGAYDTCPHGCVYCYAVRRRELALARYKAHDPRGDALA